MELHNTLHYFLPNLQQSHDKKFRQNALASHVLKGFWHSCCVGLFVHCNRVCLAIVFALKCFSTKFLSLPERGGIPICAALLRASLFRESLSCCPYFARPFPISRVPITRELSNIEYSNIKYIRISNLASPHNLYPCLT